ncbi:serine palmitoyltransferase small subunit B-like [Nycticebus coucang]|uniref:serine palmitoyltransferase small subunit B-like n=1 Tax=Nycticebus coucang TaxID=9470 RepID=UPI00234D30B6|nr:serine palmitoyltransferase small subunit B-like [Nycticebus coucang]
MNFRHMKEYFSWLYYQYQIISCCSILEPWEQSMFNTILLTIFAMIVSYTAYVFIPTHIRLAWEFFSKMCGYHSAISNWSCWHMVEWRCHRLHNKRDKEGQFSFVDHSRQNRCEKVQGEYRRSPGAAAQWPII